MFKIDPVVRYNDEYQTNLSAVWKGGTLKTITIRTRADQNGLIRLEIPTYHANQDVEIVLVMQSLISESPQRDEMGYPIGYFEATYGSFADEPLERDQPLDAELRDNLE